MQIRAIGEAGVKFGSAYIGNKIDGQIGNIKIASPVVKTLLKATAEQATEPIKETIIDKTCDKKE